MPTQGTPALPSGRSGGAVRRRLIVVGSGIAGLYAALLAADGDADVVLLTKGQLAESNTWYAQGGISAVLPDPSAGDSVAAHAADTLQAGAGHCNEDAVRLMCTEARHDIAALHNYGVCFDLGHDGAPALGLEAAHSAPRILHAGGDATGARVAEALVRSVLAREAGGKLTVLAGAYATALRQKDGKTTGLEYLRDGCGYSLEGDAVLLATGGAGQLFAQTTNPVVATADGLALAVRAGAAVRDLEFFQFHPTCLVNAATAHPARLDGPLLISEAVRGEGAILVDAGGRRFMRAYHPDAELAPRDVVSRSIALHLAKLGDPNGHVFLDARVIEQARGAGFLERRFPTLTRATRDAGIDWTRELVPVAPAAHYWMGGVATDLSARTSIPGLYAAGETARTGVHGANRLASNSLLEGLVFGRRAVEDFLWGGRGWDAPRGSDAPAAGAAGPLPDGGLGTPFSRDALRRLMTSHAGVLRSRKLLAQAAETLEGWAAVVRPGTVGGPAGPGLDPSAHEDRNLLLAAQLLVAAALDRPESLGAHYRSDEPEETFALPPKASLAHD